MKQRLAIRILLAVILITGGFGLSQAFDECHIDIRALFCSLFCQFQPTEAAWWHCHQECVVR